METPRKRPFRKALSVLLSILMVMGCISASFTVPSFANQADIDFQGDQDVLDAIEAFKDAMDEAEDAGAFGATPQWSYTSTPTSNPQNAGAHTTTITDSRDGAYVLRAAVAYEALLRTNLIELNAPSTTTNYMNVYPYTWVEQLYSVFAKQVLGYTTVGPKLSLMSALNCLRANGQALTAEGLVGTNVNTAYRSAGAGAVANNGTVSSTQTNVQATSDITALRYYDNYDDIEALLPGGVVTRIEFGFNNSIMRYSNPPTNSNANRYNAFTTMRTTNTTRVPTNILKLQALKEHFFDDNDVGGTSPTNPFDRDVFNYATKDDIDQLVTDNTAAWSAVTAAASSTSQFTKTDIDNYFGAGTAQAVDDFIQDCKDAQQLIYAQPDVEYFMEDKGATSIIPGTPGFVEFIQSGGHLAWLDEPGATPASVLLKAASMYLEATTHYDEIDALPSDLFDEAVDWFGLEWDDVQDAMAELLRFREYLELVELKARIDADFADFKAWMEAYTGAVPADPHNSLDPDWEEYNAWIEAFFMKEAKDPEGLKPYNPDAYSDGALEGMEAHFFGYLAALNSGYSQAQIDEVFTDGTDYVEEFETFLLYEIFRRGIERGTVRDAYGFFNSVGSKVTKVKSAKDLFDLVNDALTKKGNFLAQMENAALNTGMSENSFELMYTDFIPVINDGIDMIHAAMIGRLSGWVKDVLDYFDPEDPASFEYEITYDNVWKLRKIFDDIAGDGKKIYDYLVAADLLDDELMANMAMGLPLLFGPGGIITDYLAFIEDDVNKNDYAIDQHIQKIPDYPVRMAADGATPPYDDIARVLSQDYGVQGDDLDEVVRKLDALLGSPAFKDLTGMDIASCINGLPDGIFSDSVVNAVVMGLYPTVLNGLEEQLLVLPMSPPNSCGKDESVTGVQCVTKSMCPDCWGGQGLSINTCLQELAGSDATFKPGYPETDLSRYNLKSLHDILNSDGLSVGTAGTTVIKPSSSIHQLRLYPDLLYKYLKGTATTPTSAIYQQYANTNAFLNDARPQNASGLYQDYGPFGGKFVGTKVWEDPVLLQGGSLKVDWGVDREPSAFLPLPNPNYPTEPNRYLLNEDYDPVEFLEDGANNPNYDPEKYQLSAIADQLYGMSKQQRFYSAMSAAFDGVWPLLEAMFCGKDIKLSHPDIAEITVHVYGQISDPVDAAVNVDVYINQLELGIEVQEGVPGYGWILTPFFESVLGANEHATGGLADVYALLPELTGATGLTSFTEGEEMVRAIFDPLLKYFETLGQAPVGSLLELLPNLAYAMMFDRINYALQKLVIDLDVIPNAFITRNVTSPTATVGGTVASTVRDLIDDQLNNFNEWSIRGFASGNKDDNPIPPGDWNYVNVGDKLDVVKEVGYDCFTCLKYPDTTCACLVSPDGCVGCFIGGCVPTLPCLPIGEMVLYGEMDAFDTKRPEDGTTTYTPVYGTWTYPDGTYRYEPVHDGTEYLDTGAWGYWTDILRDPDAPLVPMLIGDGTDTPAPQVQAKDGSGNLLFYAQEENGSGAPLFWGHAEDESGNLLYYAQEVDLGGNPLFYAQDEDGSGNLLYWDQESDGGGLLYWTDATETATTNTDSGLPVFSTTVTTLNPLTFDGYDSAPAFSATETTDTPIPGAPPVFSTTESTDTPLPGAPAFMGPTTDDDGGANPPIFSTTKTTTDAMTLGGVPAPEVMVDQFIAPPLLIDPADWDNDLYVGLSLDGLTTDIDPWTGLLFNAYVRESIANTYTENALTKYETVPVAGPSPAVGYHINADKGDMLLFILRYVFQPEVIGTLGTLLNGAFETTFGTDEAESAKLNDGVAVPYLDEDGETQLLDPKTGKPLWIYKAGNESMKTIVTGVLGNIESHPDDAIAALVELMFPQLYEVGYVDYGEPELSEPKFPEWWANRLDVPPPSHPTSPTGQEKAEWDANYIIANADVLLDVLFEVVFGQTYTDLTAHLHGELADMTANPDEIYDFLEPLILGLLANPDLADTLAEFGPLLKQLVIIDGEPVDIVIPNPDYDPDEFLDPPTNLVPNTDYDPREFLLDPSKVLYAVDQLLNVLLCGAELEILDIDSDPGAVTPAPEGLIKLLGYKGYELAIVPMLKIFTDPFGVSNLLIDQDAFDTKDLKGKLAAITKPLLAVVDAIVTNPVEALLKLVPNMVYFLAPTKDGDDNDLPSPLQQSIDRLLRPLYVLIDTVRPIVDLQALIEIFSGGSLDEAIRGALENLDLEELLAGADLGDELIGLLSGVLENFSLANLGLSLDLNGAGLGVDLVALYDFIGALIPDLLIALGLELPFEIKFNVLDFLVGTGFEEDLNVIPSKYLVADKAAVLFALLDNLGLLDLIVDMDLVGLTQLIQYGRFPKAEKVDYSMAPPVATVATPPDWFDKTNHSQFLVENADAVIAWAWNRFIADNDEMKGYLSGLLGGFILGDSLPDTVDEFFGNESYTVGGLLMLANLLYSLKDTLGEFLYVEVGDITIDLADVLKKLVWIYDTNTLYGSAVPLDLDAIFDHIGQFIDDLENGVTVIADEDDFKNALADLFAPLVPLLRVFLSESNIMFIRDPRIVDTQTDPVIDPYYVGHSIADEGFLRVYGYNGYESGLMTILLGIGAGVPDFINQVKDYTTFKGLSEEDQLLAVLDPILFLLHALADNPVQTLLQVLPNVAYLIGDGGKVGDVPLLAQAIRNIIHPLTVLLDLLPADLAATVNGMLSPVTDLQLGSLLNGLIADLVTDIDWLNAFDIEDLVVGKLELLQRGFNSIGKDNLGKYVAVDMADLLIQLLDVTGLFDLIGSTGFQGLLELLNYPGRTELPVNPVVYPSITTADPYYGWTWTRRDAVAMLDKLPGLLDDVLEMFLGDKLNTLLRNVVGDSLFTQGNFDGIVKALQDVLAGLDLNIVILPGENEGDPALLTLGDLLDGIIEIGGEEVDVLGIIEALKTWTPGGPVTNQASFINELVSFLTPAVPLLDWLLFGEEIVILAGEERINASNGLLKAFGFEGYQYGLIPIYEALLKPLGAESKITSAAAMKTKSDPEKLRAILDPLLFAVETVIADPLAGLLKLLPTLAYFTSVTNANGKTPLEESLNNTLFAATSLFTIVTGDPMDANGLLALLVKDPNFKLDIAALLDDMLFQATTIPNLGSKLLKNMLVGTVEGYTSLSGAQAIFLAMRTGGDQADLLTALLHTIFDLVQGNKDTREAIVKLLTNLIVPEGQFGNTSIHWGIHFILWISRVIGWEISFGHIEHLVQFLAWFMPVIRCIMNFFNTISSWFRR